MKVEIKMTGAFRDEVLIDLRRKHSFAHERVGFCRARQVNLHEGKLIVLTGYVPVNDEDYLPNDEVGALINTSALTSAMHMAYYGRASNEGVFHVHLHDIPGRTRMSPDDLNSIPAVVQGLRTVNSSAPHGLLIFSADHAYACAIPAKSSCELLEVSAVGVVGPAIRVFR